MEKNNTERKSYTSPKLTKHGNIQALTQTTSNDGPLLDNPYEGFKTK